MIVESIPHFCQELPTSNYKPTIKSQSILLELLTTPGNYHKWKMESIKVGASKKILAPKFLYVIQEKGNNHESPVWKCI